MQIKCNTYLKQLAVSLLVDVLVLTQCRSLRDWVCGGPPCHQLKPREETMSVTFPTAFNRSCFACSAPSSDPGTER